MCIRRRNHALSAALESCSYGDELATDIDAQSRQLLDDTHTTKQELTVPLEVRRAHMLQLASRQSP